MIFQIQLTWLCAAAVLLATEIQRCKQPQLQCNTRDLRFRLQKRVTKRFSNSQTCKAQNCRLTNSSPSCHVSMIANWKKRKAFQAHGLAHSFQQRSFRDTAPTATEWIHNCNIILYCIIYIYCMILWFKWWIPIQCLAQAALCLRPSLPTDDAAFLAQTWPRQRGPNGTHPARSWACEISQKKMRRQSDSGSDSTHTVSLNWSCSPMSGYSGKKSTIRNEAIKWRTGGHSRFSTYSTQLAKLILSQLHFEALCLCKAGMVLPVALGPVLLYLYILPDGPDKLYRIYRSWPSDARFVSNPISFDRTCSPCNSPRTLYKALYCVYRFYTLYSMQSQLIIVQATSLRIKLAQNQKPSPRCSGEFNPPSVQQSAVQAQM